MGDEANELMEALDNAFPVPPSPPTLPPFSEPLSALQTDNNDAYSSHLLQTPQHNADSMDMEVSTSSTCRNISNGDILMEAIQSITDDSVQTYPSVTNYQQSDPEVATVDSVPSSETFSYPRFHCLITLRNTQLRQQRCLINRLQKELGEAQQQIANLNYSSVVKDNLNKQIQLKLDFQTYQTNTATNLIQIQRGQLDFAHKFIQNQTDKISELATEVGLLKISKVHILHQLRTLQAKHMQKWLWTTHNKKKYKKSKYFCLQNYSTFVLDVSEFKESIFILCRLK